MGGISISKPWELMTNIPSKVYQPQIKIEPEKRRANRQTRKCLGLHDVLISRLRKKMSLGKDGKQTGKCLCLGLYDVLLP